MTRAAMLAASLLGSAPKIFETRPSVPRGRIEAGTRSPRTFVEGVNRFVKVAGWRACPLDRVPELYCSPTELRPGCAVDAPFLPHQRRACYALVEVPLIRRAERPWNCNGKDVLNPLAVYLHTKAGEGVRFHGQGGFKLSLQNHGAFRQTDDDVGTPAVVQRLSHRRQIAPFPEEPGQRVVDDAFVAAVAVGESRHTRSSILVVLVL